MNKKGHLLLTERIMGKDFLPILETNNKIPPIESVARILQVKSLFLVYGLIAKSLSVPALCSPAIVLAAKTTM